MDDYMAWLYAIATNQPLPGEYTPATNPLDTMTGAHT